MENPFDRIRKADADALLLAESFTLGMSALAMSPFQDEPAQPTAWDRYVEKWSEDVNRRIDAHQFGAVPVGSGTESSGPVAGVGSATDGGDPNDAGAVA